MLNREEILKHINEILQEEHGTEITEDENMFDSGVDSFGMVMVLATIEGTYPNFKIDHKNLHKYAYCPIKEIIDEILVEE